MDKLASRIEGVLVGRSVNYTGPSLNLIQRNVVVVNVVTVTVFGNLNEAQNTTDIREEASVLLSVLPSVSPTLRHIYARKIKSVCHRQKTLTHREFVMKINHCDGQSSQMRLKKTASVPASEGVRVTVGTPEKHLKTH